MDGHGEMRLGQRIAAYRRLRGWTQDGLAQRLNRSTSWVAKVEQGARRIDSMSVLIELARVLRVPLHQLIGRAERAAAVTNQPADDGLNHLCKLLDRPAVLGAGATADEPSSLADISDGAAALRRLYNTSNRNFSAVVPLLPGQIGAAQRVAATASAVERPKAYAALSALYRLASLELRQRGDVVRARLAIDRALGAAEQANDDLLVASVAATLTVQLMTQGDAEDAVALALDAAEHVGRLPDSDGPSGLVVAGCLYLYAAQAAARSNDAAETRRLLKAAKQTSEQLGTDQEQYCLIFGPTNVAIQESGILVDLGKPVEALRCAEGVRPERLGSVSRSGYHYLHLAGAHGMRGNDDAVIADLTKAHRAAPELARYDPLAQEMVREMLVRKRRVGEQLRRLARDMQVLS